MSCFRTLPNQLGRIEWKTPEYYGVTRDQLQDDGLSVWFGSWDDLHHHRIENPLGTLPVPRS